jgi:hypothetical protein
MANDGRTPPPLPPGIRNRLVELIARVGERHALELLHLSRNTVARALAGLPVRVASAYVIRSRLDAIDAQPSMIGRTVRR